MDLVDLFLKVKKFGLENVFKRYYSIYPAQVVDNDDPSDRGRLKLIVPDITDDKELSQWAEPILASAGRDADASSSETNGSYGQYYPYKIGDYVWVMFRMGDIRNPLYIGSWWAKNEKPEFLSDDRKNAVFISRYGHQITVDETENAAKITLRTNNGYTIEIDETLDEEKIYLECGKSGNKIEMYDAVGNEYISITDKNGGEWKWDVGKKTWSVDFLGDKEETIDSALTQIVRDAVHKEFQDLLDLQVGTTTNIESGESATLIQPSIAIGDGQVELLDQIVTLIDKLSLVKVLTPTGPAAPMIAAAEWADVEAEKEKINSIKGSF